MTTIGDKFNQLGTSILNLVGTRASRNMDNLSTVGRDNIAALASGLPQTTISNVCLKAANVSSSGTTRSTLTVSGTFVGLIPAGKNTDGVPANAKVSPATCTNVSVNIPASEYGYTSASGSTTVAGGVKLTMFINASGTIIARRYLASYETPKQNYALATDTIWYDLNENKLKTCSNTSNTWSDVSTTVGFKIGEFTLAGDTVSNVKFDKAVQLLDAATITESVGLAKVPTGTVIAYMGTDIPEGYLPMDGRYLSQTTYADLYRVIGTSQTTTARSGYFQIADMTDGRYLMGSTVAGSSRSYSISTFVADGSIDSDTLTYKETSSTHTLTSSNLGSLYTGSLANVPKLYNPTQHTPITAGTEIDNLKKVRPRSFTWTCTTTSTQWNSGSVGYRHQSYSSTMNEMYFCGDSSPVSITKNGVTNVTCPSTLPFEKYWVFIAMGSGWASGTQTLAGTIKDIIWEVETGELIKTGSYCNAGLPNSVGYVTAVCKATSSDISPIYVSNTSGDLFDRDSGGGWATAGRINIDMSRSSDIYGNSDTVRPESLGAQYLIKY